jgi:HEPN domain-containing protein
MLRKKEGFFMPNPDPEIIKKVLQWLVFADEDLELASNALNNNDNGPYRLIAYHCQQCAEKYLKAYLVYHNVDFPYTHSIRRLLQLCARYATWPQSLENAKELTPYAITTRYPGEYEEVTEEEANRSISLAQQVRDCIRTELKKLGLNLQQ